MGRYEAKPPNPIINRSHPHAQGLTNAYPFVPFGSDLGDGGGENPHFIEDICRKIRSNNNDDPNPPPTYQTDIHMGRATTPPGWTKTPMGLGFGVDTADSSNTFRIQGKLYHKSNPDPVGNTVCFWFLLPSSSDTTFRMYIAVGNSTRYHVGQEVTTSNLVAHTGFVALDSNISLRDDLPHHVGFRTLPGDNALLIDGQVVATSSDTQGTRASNTTGFIGIGRSGSSAPSASARSDATWIDLRFYHSPLSDAAIRDQFLDPWGLYKP